MADTSVELVASLEYGTNTTDYFVPATHSSVQKQEPRSGGTGLRYIRLRSDYSAIVRARSIRARQSSRPTSAMVSPSGGLTMLPQTATRTA